MLNIQGSTGNTAMRFGPRLMRRTPARPFAGDEKAELQRMLEQSPGVSFVHSVEPHRKGGFTAILEFDRDQLDKYVQHVEEHGWMNVF